MNDNRASIGALARRGERLLEDVSARSKETTRQRIGRLRRTWLQVLQAALAAGAAWFIATEVIGHPQPFFAPIAAVISLGISLGQRLRRAVELVIGVAVGVLVADLLIAAIGRGTWQLAVSVLLAMAIAVFSGGGALLVNQAGASAILVVALVPVGGDPSAMTTSRFIDALVGGTIGLIINALLLPVNPVATARRAANPLLDELVGTLRDIATALERQDRDAAGKALARARDIEGTLEAFNEALVGGNEISRIAPVRWRMRGHLALYLDAVQDIDHAVRNVRVLARRAMVMLRVGENVEPGLPASVHRLAEGVHSLRNELARGEEPTASRRGLLDAAELATETLAANPGFSANVVVAQVRSAVYDLLLATGLQRRDVTELLGEVHEAGTGGAGARAEPSPRSEDSG